MRNTGVWHEFNAETRRRHGRTTQPLVVDGAGMPGNGVTERTGDCRLQHETDRGCVFDSASQKQLSEAQSKALSARFNTALEASLQAWQQKHHAVILVSPAVVQGAPDITQEIQQDIARRMRAEP